jgi:putative ABC transport system ATP-binding protein
MQYAPISLTPPEAPFIELKDVQKIFKTSAGEYHALKGIDLTFRRGDFAAIMGKSGSGKSTLLNMLTGIDHPTSGSVRVETAQLHRMNEGQLAVWRGKAMGIVFQFFQLLPTLSILENTLLAMDYANAYPREEREARAHELLHLLGLEEMADKLPAALSGGQQQIAAIARALANDPPILVADEPTGNLDSRTAEIVLQIFADLATRGKTILIVTHDPTLARRAARRILIADGELVNERVVEALPMLTHSQMLQITKLLTTRHYDPGDVISRQSALDEGLYIVQSGQVCVLRQGRGKNAESVEMLEPGQYFSQLEMIETEDCDLTLQAAGAVETLCVTLGQFSQWLSQNPGAESILRQAAQQHSASLYAKPHVSASTKSSLIPQPKAEIETEAPARKSRPRWWRWR